ncbi:hypothetical protein [Dickeya solani]|uniref:Uncharacterized protein n=1 Tax=Dickeya solani TaxID=1089444 RepID=A0AAX4EYM3_9GAMM|nr:hypothetical protein [Dickeya solani]WOA52533.1 hypothetical protein RXA29_22200 [Dickeya solani]
MKWSGLAAQPYRFAYLLSIPFAIRGGIGQPVAWRENRSTTATRDSQPSYDAEVSDKPLSIQDHKK